jgi:hypothetical protein
MLKLIHFVLTVLGLTYIVTQSSIMAPLRMAIAKRSALLAQLIYCPACAGFWVGMAVAAVRDSGLHDVLTAAIVACGLMATWAAAFLHTSSWQLEQEQGQDDATQKEGEGSHGSTRSQ